MPSETIDFKSLSSSLYSFEDICSSTKKLDGFQKSENLSNFCENSIVDVIATQHESSLFSSSLSKLFSRKSRLSANNALYGHSVDNAASQYEEDMLFESLEELEAQTIGNLLPNDDDDLLTGLTDGLDHIVQDSAVDDLDEQDIFASVGGMDLGNDDDNSSSAPKNSEFLDGTCNDRLELRTASSIAGEHFSRASLVKNIHPELEQKEYSCYLHRKSPPLKSPTSRHAMSAPSLETSFLHGVSSNVPSTSPSQLKVKSVGNQHRITESGLPRELNFGIQASSPFDPHSPPECHDGLSNVFLCNPPDLASNINRKTHERKESMQFCQANYNGHASEFNEYAFKSYGNGSCALPGHHYKWRNSYHTRGMKSNSTSYFDGVYAGPTLPRLHGVPRSPSHMMRPVLSMNNYHVLSPPAVNCNIWNIQPAYATHSVDLTSHDNFPHFGRNCVDLQFPPKNVELQLHDQRSMMFPGRSHMIPMFNSFGTHKERARSRRNVGGSNLVDKKHYELDLDCIKKGEDNRTTLMIKNIPNKYTSKMLLAAIDEHHKGTYDFIYLPIDFKNKCNVGYAFINLTDPTLIIPFYQVINGKKWEKFNSEKVATLAYARIQGKAALIAHFQNSSLMNEDKRCRPILFSTDGPNAGDQVPFPVGVNIHNKLGRSRDDTLEDKLAVCSPDRGTRRLSPGGDCDSKESN